MANFNIEYRGLNIGVGSDYFVNNVEGLHAPAIRTSSSPLTDQDGGIIWSQKYAGRELGITGDVVGDDADSYFANLRALIQAFSVTQEDFDITITRWGDIGATRILQGRVTMAPDPVEVTGEIDFSTFRIVMFAGNPFFLDTTTQSESTGLQESTGAPLGIPMGFPLGGVSSGTLTIVNGGDVPAFAKFIITDQVTNPTISNLTTGKSFQILDTLVAGDTVEVFRDQEGFHVEKNGSNAFSTFSGDFFNMALGTNVIKFSSLGASVTAGLTVEFTNHYLSI